MAAKATGIDHFEPFIEKAKRAISGFHIEGDEGSSKSSIELICSDLIDVDYSSADFIYFYSTGFDEAYIQKLSLVLNAAPKGCKLVTISFALKECDKKTPFYVKKRKKNPFSLGAGVCFFAD